MNLALSIRQPWAWLIVNGHKTVENRTRVERRRRGWFLVHASGGMTRAEYDYVKRFLAMRRFRAELPAFKDLQRGGIVGRMHITGAVDAHPSPFFFGPHAYVIDKAEPLEFFPCSGRLGFFPVTGGPTAEPARQLCLFCVERQREGELLLVGGHPACTCH